MILVGYQGIGKSTLSKTDLKFIDLESSAFWIRDEKGFKRYDDWYKIYAEQARMLSDQGYNVFISSHKVICDYMYEKGIEFVTISPAKSLYDEWVKKLKDRYYNDPCDKNHKTLMNCIEKFNINIEELQSEKYSIIINDKNYVLKDIINDFIKENNEIKNSRPKLKEDIQGNSKDTSNIFTFKIDTNSKF